MKIKAIIFDLDGTLYDNTKLPRYVIAHSLFHLRLLANERISRHHMAGRYYGTKGATYHELFRRISLSTGVVEEKVAAWYWQIFLPLQVKMLQKHFHPKPWVKTLLPQLKEKGIKLACFSEYGFVREKLKALDIDLELFDLLIDAPSAGGCKPCRKAFLRVAEKLETAPEDILMMGDRENSDGAGAEAAGMHFYLSERSDNEIIDLSICE